MGYKSYSSDSRSSRLKSFATSNNIAFEANTLTGNAYVNVHSAPAFNKMFAQQALGKMHESMNPKGIKFRECLDSEAHPNTVPIIVGLDVTGSMGKIPKDFVMDGLPTMMSTIIQRGTPDAAVCFMAIGDHTCDSAPVQVGQFESGDTELDMWLTRTWLEGHGGTNDGESYALPWYVAAFHTKIDSCTKRSKKGFLFTVGDEPNLSIISGSALKEIFGESKYAQSGITAREALEAAQECYNVYHFALSKRGEASWKNLLGQNYIPVEDYTTIPKLIAEIVNSYNTAESFTVSVPASVTL